MRQADAITTRETKVGLWIFNVAGIVFGTHPYVSVVIISPFFCSNLWARESLRNGSPWQHDSNFSVFRFVVWFCDFYALINFQSGGPIRDADDKPMEPGPTICIKVRHLNLRCLVAAGVERLNKGLEMLFVFEVPEGAAGKVIQVPHPKAKGR